MTTLATPQALAAVRGVTYDPTDLTSVLALEGASAAVRSYCGQSFDLVDDDVTLLDGSGGEGLLLPELPVLDVTAVSEVDADGVETALAATDYVLDPHGAGILYRLGGALWPRGRSNVSVTYSHGYSLPGTDGATLPVDLQLVVIQMAARVAADPTGRAPSAESVGSYSVTYGARTRSDILPMERHVLDRYRVRRVV